MKAQVNFDSLGGGDKIAFVDWNETGKPADGKVYCGFEPTQVIVTAAQTTSSSKVIITIDTTFDSANYYEVAYNSSGSAHPLNGQSGTAGFIIDNDGITFRSATLAWIGTDVKITLVK